MKISMILKYLLNKETYITPVCPKCGSPITGRIIVLGTNSNVDRFKRKYLKSGEYIKPRLYQCNQGSPNAFCVHCGNEWSEDDIKIVFPTKKELREIKENNRIIYDPNDEYLEDLHYAYDNNISYLEYVDILNEEETEDGGEVIKSKSGRPGKIGKNIKKATGFFWKNIVVSSTIGVLEDIFPGAEKKRGSSK